MQIFIPNGRARCLMPVALILAFTFAHAQPQTDTKKPLRGDPVSAETPIEAVPYRSAFTDYRPLRDEPVAAWKDAHDMNATIGGWLVYAREARQPDTPTAAPTSAQVKDHAGHQGGQQ